MYFDLSAQEAASFLAFSRFTSLDGPQRLVRFTDSTRGHEAKAGKLDERTGIYRSYWMYAAAVEEVLDQVSGNGPYGLKLIGEVSRRWAVCDDWGDLGRVWVMEIPAGHKVDGYCGFAKFQPKISAQAQKTIGRVTTNSYEGGAMQFVLGLTEQQRRWISGPLPTLSLSKRKLNKLSPA